MFTKLGDDCLQIECNVSRSLRPASNAALCTSDRTLNYDAPNLILAVLYQHEPYQA